MFLFNVRSPIERLISGFNYHRQSDGGRTRGCGQDSNCKSCFAQNFNAMVETTSQKPGTIATNEECSTIGVCMLYLEELVAVEIIFNSIMNTIGSMPLGKAQIVQWPWFEWNICGMTLVDWISILEEQAIWNSARYQNYPP